MASILEVKDKVQRYLASEFNGVTIDSDGDYSFRIDSARVFVSVSEWGEERTVVSVFSLVLLDVPITPELMEYVATEGNEYVFGHCALQVGDDGVGRVIFQHSILGDFLDKDELLVACMAVGSFAENEDDPLKERFGGHRFHED